MSDRGAEWGESQTDALLSRNPENCGATPHKP